MSKKIRKLNMLAMLLLLIIGVGYASLKINISIDGTTTIKNNNFVIKLANIVTKDGSVIPTNPPTIGADAMSINFDVTLSNPGEYYEFDVDVVNAGTLNAGIESYTITELTEQQSKYLTFEVKYSDGSEIKKGDVLSINGQRTINVLLKYKDEPEEYPQTSEETLSLKFSINYIEIVGGDENPRTSQNAHAQILPGYLTSTTNLYNALNVEIGYYNQTEFLEKVSGYDVVSITIPVFPGDKIKSSSFDSPNPLALTQLGIRVTYLNDDTIVKSMTATETYNEYSPNGYLTVPEGVNAVCIPWWYADDANWAYLLVD